MKRIAFVLPAVTGAFLAHAAIAPAASPKLVQLRAIADECVASKDVEGALAALARTGAPAKDLLAALREPRLPVESLAGGHHTVDLRDGAGTKTELELVAPPDGEIQKRAAKGLGLVVVLHGIKGRGMQVVPFAKDLAATGEVVVAAPTAQALPAGLVPEDGVPSFVAKQFKQWWEYDSPRSIALEAIRKARSLYPIDPDRVVLCGVSMGGYGTWNIGLRHADRFAAIAPLAGGLTRLGTVGLDDENTAALVPNGKLFPLFAVHGDQDTIVPYAPDKQAADRLQALGGDVTFRTIEGVGHDLRDALLKVGPVKEELTTFLTSKKRSLPSRVSYVSHSATLDGAYWLRAKTRARSAARVTLEGSIDKAANRISVKATGADVVRVYLDDRLLDPAKPVTIAVDGQVRWRGKIAVDARAVLESWLAREDERLVYPAFVDLTLAARRIY